jgi:hypothetical protein
VYFEIIHFSLSLYFVVSSVSFFMRQHTQKQNKKRTKIRSLEDDDGGGGRRHEDVFFVNERERQRKKFKIFSNQN